MVKLKSLLFESKILIPRRTPEERERGLIAEQYRIIQRYIRDGCQGGLYLQGSPIKVLPNNLTHVGGNLNLYESKIEDLNNLEEVDGYVSLEHCSNLKSLGKLKKCKTSLNIENTNIETLGNLEFIGNNSWARHTPNLKSLGKLKYVGRDLYLKNSNILNIMSEEDIRNQVDIKRALSLSD